MNLNFDLERFIREKVTKRERSLLAEDFARYDAELHARLDGRRVLVIGGAGSIGSHYIKALLRFDVAKLVVVDISENGLTELVRDLRSAGTCRIPRDFVTYPVNFGDRVFGKLFAAHGPFDVVANFAAHKHVRSEKDVFSIEAMIENNVLRAKGLLDLLVTCPPQHFFCVSTDKAANPVNIMGASKKLMEELIMAYADRLPIKTARFANVAFSNGSLPLGFLERLFKRQPWSCPLGIRRFFVSPIESGELCLMASIMGESGDIVFPKLDEARDMIPFDQVAVDLLHALGLEPDVCKSEDEAREKMRMRSSLVHCCGSALVGGQEATGNRQSAIGNDSTHALMNSRTNELLRWPVYFFESDTSGEKTFEEFYTPGEVLDLETFVNLGVVKNAKRRDLKDIDAIFTALRALFGQPDVTKTDVVHVLKDYLPNFAHIETGKSLDQKM
ncbi:MAG TPA: polysaccharide biosynthesis protein [Kiritimatiellia bacterium]|nr:polysaccharide biosynthesis protein [Kiritimatiellia bacterium]HPS06931.1 polysaccharide biosynthesis protein [Kiritimatiellia bacterium]